MKLERIDPPTMRTPDEYYTHVIRAGNMAYVAGQASVGKDGKIIGVGDVVAQTEEVFRQVRECLRTVGSDLGHVVKMTTFITNPDDVMKVASVRSRLLREANFRPASTLVVVSRLAKPEMLVEVECTALIPQ
jgi:enamine deaminase RidA (YjgF/YER057c/UK114 family)